MTVLHLISSGGMYGAEAVILNLSRVLLAGGEHRSILAVFVNGTHAPAQVQAAAHAAGIEVHELPCRGQIDGSIPARIRALVESTGADVLHAHGYKADVYAALAMRGSSLRGKARPALISTCHTWYDNDVAVRLYGALDRWVLRGFDGVVAVSEEVRSRLLRAGVLADHIRLIRNGVDLRPFAVARAQRSVTGGQPSVTQTQRSVTEAGRAEHDTVRVGLVGRLAPEKGIDIFLHAVARYLENCPAASPPVTFVVVGEGPDQAKLQALQTELGLGQHLTFAGHCGDMPAFYASLDILVSSSRQEGLPMALLEGMGSGLPLLATSVGEVPQLARADCTMLLVAPNDPVALAEGLARLLGDPVLRGSMGAAAQQLIADEFSAEAMAAEYLDFYRSAESSPHAAFPKSEHAAQVR